MQIAAVASAMGLAGTAIANDTDRAAGVNDNSAATLGNGSSGTSGSANDASRGMSSSDGNASSPKGNASSSKDLSGNASSSTSSNLDKNAAPALNRGGDLSGSADVNGPNANPLTANPTPDLNGQADRGSGNGHVDRGSTQGSTMNSPRSNDTSDANGPTGGARYGSGSEATTIGGQDRLGNTNSDNFNTWMSDYASQHNGHITRQEFLAQMGDRWDQRDTQHQGLTPYEVQEIFVFTPGENMAPARTGSDVRPGDMGAGNSRGK